MSEYLLKLSQSIPISSMVDKTDKTTNCIENKFMVEKTM